MSKELVSAMQQLNSEHHEVIEQIDVCENFLQQVNEDSKEIEIDLKNLKDLLAQANETNIELRRHVTKIFEHLKILHSPLEQLERTLPTINELDDETIKPKLARLGLLSEKIETMKKQRQVLLKDFREKIQEDHISKLLLMHQHENYKELFANEMKKHDEIVGFIKQNCRAQENLIQAMTEANADLADRRSTMIKAFESRQRLIQEIIESYRAFDDTMAKANEGLDFYKKQTEKLEKIHQRLTTMKNQQMTKTTTTSSDRPRLKDYLAAMKPETWSSTSMNRVESTIYRSAAPPPPMANAQIFAQQYQVPPVSYPIPSYAPMPFPTGQFFAAVPPPPIPQPNFQSAPMNYPSVYPNGSMPMHPLPPMTRFDLYRPQPVSAYEIPCRTQPIGLMNPNDVYRPGGLFRLAQTTTIPPISTTVNNRVSDEQNQYVPTAAFANFSLNSMSNL